MLFVGNSYVDANDLPDEYRTIAEGLPLGSLRVEAVTTGGHRLRQHAADADTDGTPLAHWLRTGRAEETAFDAVVLQEQSQIGGFREFTEQRELSASAASRLAALASARGSMVVLFLTWGREHGDPANPDFYPTFEIMQDRLDIGYRNMAARLHAEGVRVAIAPVGPAFRIVFRDVAAASLDPLAEGSDFDALYDADGSHPSLRGTYLAACVIAATIHGADPRAFPDHAALGSTVSFALRDACARAVADPVWSVADEPTAGASFEIEGEATEIMECSIAMSAAGDRALLGATATMPAAEPASSRALAVALAMSADGWTEEARLGPADPQLLGPGGRAVAVSAGAERALLGGPPRGPTSASARVFRREAAGWAEETLLVGRDPMPGIGYTSAAVALSGDGTRAVVGAALDIRAGAQTGSARVFAVSSGGWAEEAILAPLDGAEADLFGAAVAISADGTTLLIGAPSADSGMDADVGRVRVYARDDGGWHEQATLVPGTEEPGDRLGESVALSADGNVALLGTWARGGLVRSFLRSGASWVEMPGPTPIAAVDEGSGFGASIALSADGTRALVGAATEDNAFGFAAGAAYVFERSATGWTQIAHVVSSAGANWGGFGRSVAMSADGRTVLVSESARIDGPACRASTFRVP